MGKMLAAPKHSHSKRAVLVSTALLIVHQFDGLTMEQ